MYFYDSTRTATAEYPQDRVHLVPQWNAVTDPFHAPADAWQLNMPPLKENERARGAVVARRALRARSRQHRAVARPDGHAAARRRCDARHRVGAAFRRPRDPGRYGGGGAHPHDVARLASSACRAARCATRRALVLTARIPASPAVVGTEVLAPRGELSVRTRFGITPPAPLSALKPGEAAISEPVLISTAESSNGADGALGQMLGSTVVRAQKIGVYWETYGYAAGDSVDVAVIITRHREAEHIPQARHEAAGRARHQRLGRRALERAAGGSRLVDDSVEGADPGAGGGARPVAARAGALHGAGPGSSARVDCR